MKKGKLFLCITAQPINGQFIILNVAILITI